MIVVSESDGIVKTHSAKKALFGRIEVKFFCRDSCRMPSLVWNR